MLDSSHIIILSYITLSYIISHYITLSCQSIFSHSSLTLSLFSLLSLFLFLFLPSDQRDWNSLKRACHTWKGRASQIGFCKSSFIAASLLDFIQNTVASSPRDSEVTDWLMSTSPHAEMVLRQVEIFWESLNKECLVISSFLKSQCLL